MQKLKYIVAVSVDKQRTLIRIYMEKYISVWRYTNDNPRILYAKKKPYALKTPHVVALPFIYGVEYINLPLVTLLPGSLLSSFLYSLYSSQ